MTAYRINALYCMTLLPEDDDYVRVIHLKDPSVAERLSVVKGVYWQNGIILDIGILES